MNRAANVRVLPFALGERAGLRAANAIAGSNGTVSLNPLSANERRYTPAGTAAP